MHFGVGRHLSGPVNSGSPLFISRIVELTGGWSEAEEEGSWPGWGMKFLIDHQTSIFMQWNSCFDKSTLKIIIWPQNFNVFQLKPKFTWKSIFLAIKPFINSIKPSIKFNWVYKHLILDISSSNWIFLCQYGSHQSMIYCQILIFLLLYLLNQFLAIFWAFWHPLFTAIIF